MHSEIVSALVVLLKQRFRGTAYRLFMCDVLTKTAKSVRYPDVVVTRDERDTRDAFARSLEHPVLIIEVLSESTESIDRVQKVSEYRSIDTLEEYVLIDSRQRLAEIHRRGSAGWVRSIPIGSGRLELTSVDATIDLDELYESVGL